MYYYFGKETGDIQQKLLENSKHWCHLHQQVF